MNEGTSTDVLTETVNGDVRMRVGKYVCPSAYVNVFTPIEFEEIVDLFDKFDEDRSGELSINEMRTLLFQSDMGFDENCARDLLRELDEDESGLIDFGEFCTFLARVKAGDLKLKRFGGLIHVLNATPVGILEEQCFKRRLKVSYHIVDERPATALDPLKTYLMEVLLEGEWVKPSEVGMVSSIETRRFQGFGKTTREGRMRAAEAALAKLRGLMPGLEVPTGDLPTEWERWLKSNAKQGLSLESLLAQLRSKGFAPYANPRVMQWTLAFTSFDRLIRECPTANPTVHDGTEVGPELRAWIDHCLGIGLEGAILVQVMQDKGISTSGMEAYTQSLRRGDGASCADVVNPRLLDFWQCCESGLVFEVELYLSAGQSPNQTALHVPRGVVSLPLALAASRGQSEVVDALVSWKADVKSTDMMGRTALHHAAKCGNVGTCMRLLEHSAPLNAKDSVGCTPLHMAARYNKAACCQLLAFYGEETVRSVVNDRIPVAGKPFTEILETSFQHMLKTRLKPNETRRFRKEWIYGAVLWCREQMDEDKRHLLQEPGRELVGFVARRFDPDPEAGFWQLNEGQPPTFVPSVAEPWHLSEMIRDIFRLAVCGSRDNRGWTVLHQACFENRISSHEETIRVLVDFHQLNLFQVDINNKLAIDLLLAFDNGRPNIPSGSREKESLLMEQRKGILAEDRKRQDAEKEEEKERCRIKMLEGIRKKAVDMDSKLWLITQEASLHLRTLGGWKEYVDPETFNRFYYRRESTQHVAENSQDKLKEKDKYLPAFPPDDIRGQPPTLSYAIEPRLEAGRSQSGGNIADSDGDMVEADSIDHFQWDKPEEFKKEEAYLLGWASIINGSEFIRTHAKRYNAVLDCKTGVVFYVDTFYETCSLTPPREATLSWAFEHSTPTTRVLGQRREWEVRIDEDGNELYCSERMQRVNKGRVVEEVFTRDLRWERPVDAIQPVDLTATHHSSCTMDVAGYERVKQPWYICHECDAEWKKETERFRICVACARICHKERLGHRTRYCKVSSIRCMCCETGEGRCLFFKDKEEVVQGFLEKRCTAADEKAALDAAEESHRVSPPIVAYVPNLWPDGTPKELCGWQICRRKSDTLEVNGWTVCHDPELPRRIPVGAKVMPRSARDIKMEVRRSNRQAAARRTPSTMITKGVFFWRSGHVLRAVSDDWYIVRIDGRAADELSAEENGLARVEPLEWEISKDRLCMEGSPLFFFHKERRECTWESPLEANLENPSWPETGEEKLPSLMPHEATEKSETIAHDRHHGRTLEGAVGNNEKTPPRWRRDSGTGTSTRTRQSVQAFRCGYPPLCLDEWESMRKTAKVLCIRGRYTTYLDRETACVFYHDEVLAARDKLVTMVQRKWRRVKRRKGEKRIGPRSVTEAFSFEPFEELREQMRLCTAWAYLRRSALLVRQVEDRDRDTWEEYQDRSTGLRFFYCPELLKSRFHPPDMHPPISKEFVTKTRLNLGDRVAFRFRGDTVPSTAKVVKVRETQDQTDAGDTVVSVHYDVTECEIACPQLHSAELSTIPVSSTSDWSLEGSRGSENGGVVKPRTERWLDRQVLTKAPKTAEEIALDKKEAEWRQELVVAKTRHHRELSKKVDEQYRAERLRKRGPAGVMLVRRERGRTAMQAKERRARRTAAEKALREEEDRLAAVEAQKVTQELVAGKTRRPKAVSKDARYCRERRHQQSSSKALKQASEQPTEGYSIEESTEAGGNHHEHQGRSVSKEIQEKGAVDGGDDLVLKPKEDQMGVREEALFEKLRTKEDRMTTPRTVKRRGLIRRVHMAMVRQADGFVICEWGCRAWVRLGQEVFFHQTEQCSKRILPCEQGCGLRMREEEWLGPSSAKPEVPCQQQHEEEECPRRLVLCKQRCGEWLPFEELLRHMKVSCVKRPSTQIRCRLGCGEAFEGGRHRMLQSEEERIDHEHELCPHRLLHCAWTGCEEMIKAKDRKEHRKEHVIRTGVSLFAVPGKYNYKVPRGCRHLKVQVWGAGGGSGHFKGGQCGDGGGGAFAEAFVHVSPGDDFEITVGGCGSAGVYGSEVSVPRGVDTSGKPVVDIVDKHGVAEGGWPGGGDGHGGRPNWAAGGGGGYSMIARKVSRYGEGRTEPYVVAGGGGGGGSRAGVPGGGLDGEIPGTKVDIRNGRMGTATKGGAAGDSGNTNGCTFPPKHGQPWDGGAGGQYGGGGGSGWFGGGGGGTAPGIVGGGGGGSSFINTAVAMDLVVLQGIGLTPGGTDRAPPRARGRDEDDIVGGVCGAGGKAGPWELNPGKNGAVRLQRPGFFDKQLARN
ncbi:unnamed protein product [Ascophyllum nodosum]